MDLGVKDSERLQRIRSVLNHAKYPLLAAAVGLAILLFPTKPQEAAVSQPEPQAQEITEPTQSQMAAILSKIDGAGAVEVLLTFSNGGRTEYQTDLQTSVSGDKTEKRVSTVFRSGSQGEALVSSVTAPEYRGAVVVSRGADNPRVRLDLVKAVSSLTGLSSDKITVLKMKG